MLVTKVLLPQRRKDVLTRPRLLRRLYDLIDRKIILMSAPAGYGKSTLLVDFAQDLEHPVCWYSLDQSDQDPRVFLEHLILSLQHRFPEFGEASRQALNTHKDLSNGAPGLISVLINEIVQNIPRWFVLVLDDYHHLGSNIEINAILEQILTYQTDQFLLIIASRTVPEFPFTIRLAARGQIGGIGQEDLQFRPEDIQKLLAQNYNLHISEREAEELAAQSEGWITGLLLTVQTMWKGILANLTRAQSANQPVYEYLAQEVFAQQPPAVQEFLIASSTLKSLNPNLCQEALGLHGAERFIAEIEDRNLFIIRFEDGWYRYHHLFQEYLQQRFRKKDPDRWEAFQRRAAGWFLAQGRFEEAVDHYMTAEAYDKAADVMQDAARKMFLAGHFRTLMRWGDNLPTPQMEKSPRLALFQSRAADMLAQWDKALTLAAQAEEGYQIAEDKSGVAYAQLHRCEIWQKQGRLQEALDLGKEVLAFAQDNQLPVTYEAERIIGRSLLDLGNPQDSERHLRKALEASYTQATEFEQASVRTALLDCLLRQGKLKEAITVQEQVVEIRRRLNSPASLAEALNDLGYALYLAGEHRKALPLFEESLTLARRCGHRRGEGLTLLSLCELLQSGGAPQQALEICQEGIAVANDLGDRFLSACGQEVLGLVYYSLGKPDQAEAAIQRALDQVSQQGSIYQQARYRAVLEFVRAMGGSPKTSSPDLDEASRQLAELGGGSDWAQARLFNALVLFASDQKRKALEVLSELVKTLDYGTQAPLLANQGHLVLPLLRYALRQDNADKCWTALYDRVQSFQQDIGLMLNQKFAVKDKQPPEIRIYGFGIGRVERNGEEIPISDWGAAATRLMLFYMLMHSYRTRDQIANVLWEDLPADKVKATFHTTKFRLKRALGTEVLSYEGGYYKLHPDFDHWFDVRIFEELIESPTSESRIEHLQAAIDLYKGDFLEDCYDDWCIQLRQALREECLTAIDELTDLWLARRRYRHAIRILFRGLEIDNLRESFHRNLIRTYALAGERSQALNQYQRWKNLLEAELNTVPSESTTTLYKRVLRGIPLD